MVQDDDHPQMIAAHHELLRRLGVVLGNGRNPLTKPFLDRLFDVVKDHREKCRMNNIDFPVLVALVIPRLGIVEFARADLDISSLKIKIVNFVRQYPRATMQEVVQAFRMAYPDLKPDDVISGHASGISANERQGERMKEFLKDLESGESDSEGKLQ